MKDSQKNSNEANVPWKNIKGRWFFAFAAACAIISFAILLQDLSLEKKCMLREAKYRDGITYSLWLIVPPIWFLIEYIWIFPDRFKFSDKHFGDFKFTQELASKFWAALLVLFGIIIYVKYRVHIG